MDIEAFIKLRPRLYHLTSLSNFELIQQSGTLISSANIYERAGQSHLVDVKRPASERVHVDGDVFTLRDQAPLYEGNCDLQFVGGFSELIAYLNAHVYFWPGKEDGPIDYGQRHFARYRTEDAVVLSWETQSLFACNAGRTPLFSRCNSGSPRCVGGKKQPRGPATFSSADCFTHRPSSVVEVVYRGQIDLPVNNMRVQSVSDYSIH